MQRRAAPASVPIDATHRPLGSDDELARLDAAIRRDD
jgi:hypothetical protein